MFKTFQSKFGPADVGTNANARFSSHLVILRNCRTKLSANKVSREQCNRPIRFDQTPRQCKCHGNKTFSFYKGKEMLLIMPPDSKTKPLKALIECLSKRPSPVDCSKN